MIIFQFRELGNEEGFTGKNLKFLIREGFMNMTICMCACICTLHILYIIYTHIIYSICILYVQM